MVTFCLYAQGEFLIHRNLEVLGLLRKGRFYVIRKWGVERDMVSNESGKEGWKSFQRSWSSSKEGNWIPLAARNPDIFKGSSDMTGPVF